MIAKSGIYIIYAYLRQFLPLCSTLSSIRTLATYQKIEHFVKSGGNPHKIPKKAKMKIHDLCNMYSKMQCVKSHVVQNYFLFFLLISCSFFIAFSFLLRCSSETFFLRMYLLVEVPILLSFHFFIQFLISCHKI